MGYEIKNLKKFNNELKTLEERKSFVQDLLDENIEMIEGYTSTSMLEGENRFEEKELNITIEMLATYLLKSQDVESCRSGEFTFYESERDYRSRYQIGKNTYSTDMSNRDDISKIHYDSYDGTEDEMTIDVSVMNSKEIAKLIRLGIREKDIEGSRLKRYMEMLYSYIYINLNTDRDLKIFDLMISGKSDNEISDTTGLPRRTVNYNVNKIINVVGGFRFED